ncbi:Haloacid dehalogenase-like hydrolase domain-containing protein 2 [Seminavis robusta]|uniref:Haloacid dehalogenase-like hydrolase domain-containing protein 2 n=1 Tax=Seminavis robusta TaxID=568900 RepID=A0A9N8H8L6_9STRA|nr:Haloacid dehalogenase-like hydrolase domain-containing protein 2 [Seminavis robusta]|eukprot:Sro94_g049050.1 Haloacid dehalogenase-like hydrolase domain-containing protein 2 (287) ;mRNA; f:83700-84650
MTTVRTVLLDLSGTIHIGDKLIPGALAACQKLVQNNVSIKFLTNTTKSSRRELLDQLYALGFEKDLLKADSLITNTQAAKQVVQKYKLKPYCLVQESLLGDLGLAVGGKDDDEIEYNSVLVGLAPEACYYQKLNDAFRILMKEKERRKKEAIATAQRPPLLIALHRGKYLRDADGGLSLGPGGFVACLQEAAGLDESDIAVMGKPTGAFFHAAIPEGISPPETVMVGDDVKQDVIGAKEAGIGLGILVKTGKYQEGDEVADAGEAGPDIVVSSIVEAVEYILARQE